jgi:hypothetical protein
LKFLHLCDQNWVGMASAFVDAHRRAGHEARLVTMVECANEFDEDICLRLPFLQGTALHLAMKKGMDALHGGRPRFTVEEDGGVPQWKPRGAVERLFFKAREEILWKPRIERAICRHGLGDFDIYHLESGVGLYRDARFLREAKQRGAKIVCYYLGTDLRDRGAIPAVREIADLSFTCEWDHLGLDSSLEYFFIPFDASRYEYADPDAGPLRISHAPRNRWYKGTETILRAVERARSRVAVEIDLIEGVTHDEAIRRKRQSNLLIDQVGNHGATGYGMNSLEALAMGIPCITSLTSSLERKLGDHPFLVATPESLTDLLVELASDPDRRREASRKGRSWVESVHDADAVVAGIYARYRELGWMGEGAS